MYSTTLVATQSGKDSSSTVNTTTGIVAIWRGSREELLPTMSQSTGSRGRIDDDCRTPAHTPSRFAAAAAAAIIGSQGGLRVLLLVILVPALYALLLAIGVL